MFWPSLNLLFHRDRGTAHSAKERKRPAPFKRGVIRTIADGHGRFDSGTPREDCLKKRRVANRCKAPPPFSLGKKGWPPSKAAGQNLKKHTTHMPTYIFQEITPKNVQVVAVDAPDIETANTMVKNTQSGHFELIITSHGKHGGLTGSSRPNEPTQNRTSHQSFNTKQI